MAVRAAKIEIAGFGKASGQRDNWKKLSVDCQRMTNRLWQIWLVHHVNNGSASKLREHFEAYRKWNEADKRTRGAKPAWPCKVVEPPLTKSADSASFYRILSAEFPGVNVRTRGLLTNAWQSKLNKRKAASGNLPGWVSILFANESLPSFTKPQPIPFDKDNAKLRKDGKDYVLELRVERLADGKSVVEPCALILGKRKCRSVRATVDKILSGEFAWKGSSIIFERGKWFASISYEMPSRERPELDTSKILYVRPGRLSPWRVSIGRGRSWRFGGNGKHVEYARRTIQKERIGRGEHYRWSGANQKGHGGDRARSVWTKLSSRWKDFTKRYNNEVTRQIVNMAVNRGCGRIVYLQPTDRCRRSAMYWDYFQFGSILAAKCETEGVEYGVEKRNTKNVAAGSVRGVRKAVPSVNQKREKKTPACVR
jgi:hypothetical protein